MLEQVEHVCGWTTPQLQELQESARHVGVSPTGTVLRLPTLRRPALTKRVTAVLSGVDRGDEFHRDLDPTLLRQAGRDV